MNQNVPLLFFYKGVFGIEYPTEVDHIPYSKETKLILTQSVGTAQYIDCISAEGYDSSNECPGYDTKQSDGEAPAMELWGMRCTSLLTSLAGPFWAGVVTPDRVLSMGQREPSGHPRLRSPTLCIYTRDEGRSESSKFHLEF